MTIRPVIVILHATEARVELIRALQLGLEEEGVPTQTRVGVGDIATMARLASDQSTMFLGIGVDSTGSIVLQDSRLGNSRSLMNVFSATPEQARAIGVAAGRIAKCRPFLVMNF